MVRNCGTVGDLRARLLCGERDALVELFDEHRARLRQIVHFRLDPRVSARVDPDDVLQDAFLDASLRLAHYRDETQFSPFVWLRLIVSQTLIDVHRRHLGAQQRAAGREFNFCNGALSSGVSVSIAAHFIAHWTSPSQTAMRSELGAKLRNAINNMEPFDREVLALRHFEELTNKEVAELLQIGEKAASIRYVRAIARLKNILVNMPEFSALYPVG
ncbi:MAG: sigma-70 family RNA polymerase sigma factor [Planctomycetota bacterium]|nr:sigma-70 family RNA polymerase sigma factor [Planctomycetota bacterium]